MLLYNPTKNKITIVIKGREYSIDAEQTSDFPEDVATLWKNKIHQFLEIKTKQNVQDKEVETKEVTKEDKVEEIVEEVEVITKKTNKKK